MVIGPRGNTSAPGNFSTFKGVSRMSDLPDMQNRDECVVQKSWFCHTFLIEINRNKYEKTGKQMCLLEGLTCWKHQQFQPYHSRSFTVRCSHAPLPLQIS
uniref:Uncharacterized protein n=1 Tax=Eutreptiella gymnastica TaxID=73025 RepID=A0A7S1J8S6_9EUGL